MNTEGFKVIDLKNKKALVYALVVFAVIVITTLVILLPSGERNRAMWSIPAAKYTKSYGFGQSMVWYPNEPEAQQYVTRLVGNIQSYRGENWLNKFPE